MYGFGRELVGGGFPLLPKPLGFLEFVYPDRVAPLLMFGLAYLTATLFE
jgi:hypothetical protein